MELLDASSPALGPSALRVATVRTLAVSPLRCKARRVKVQVKVQVRFKVRFKLEKVRFK